MRKGRPSLLCHSEMTSDPPDSEWELISSFLKSFFQKSHRNMRTLALPRLSRTQRYCRPRTPPSQMSRRRVSFQLNRHESSRHPLRCLLLGHIKRLFKLRNRPLRQS